MLKLAQRNVVPALASTVSLSVLDQYGGTKLLKPAQIRWVSPSPLPSKPIDIAFKEALASPIGSKPFDREKCWSPAILISDYTRKYSPFVSRLVSIIEPKTDDIKIIIAGGTHAPSQPDFLRTVLGKELFTKYKKSTKVSSVKNQARKNE